MDTLYTHTAGIDIGKREIVCSVRTPQRRQTRTFGRMTGPLLEMADWLVEHAVTHVAMESTGVYWKPLYNLLEGYDFTLLLVNPRDFRAVPGRKTDVCDAEWLCDLLRHGLLRSSFVPERSQRELRELVRYRKHLVEERTREFNRLEKTLEGANVHLASVASSMTGKSVRQMLWALAEGETDCERLAELAQGRLRAKRTQLIEALVGLVGPHQRFLLREQLLHLDEIEARLERLSREIAERLTPFEEALARLETIPGVGRRTAEALVAEIGLDMSRFPSADHLASWAKMCPGNNTSAGKRKSGRTGQGNRYLRTTLVEAAQAAARCKGTYLQAQYRRLAARRGGKRAAIAVGHTILRIAYVLLREGREYEDLGANYFDEHREQAVVGRMRRRLEQLGYEVALEKRAA